MVFFPEVSKKRVGEGPLDVAFAKMEPGNRPDFDPATPVAAIHLGPLRTYSVIDTGADCSVMRLDLFKKLPPEIILTSVKPNQPPCISATGSPLEVVREARIRLRIGPVLVTHRFRVANNLKKPLILGSDFLSATGATIHFGQRKMVLNDRHEIRLGRKRNYKRTKGPRSLHLPLLMRAPDPKQPAQNPTNDTRARKTQNPKKRKPRKVHQMVQEICPEEEPKIGGAYPDIGTKDKRARRMMIDFLKSQEHMFAATDLDLGCTHLMNFEIDTGDNPPVKQRPYRVAWTQRKIIDKFLDDMLDAGVIVPSSSAWSSPVIIVPKKKDPQSKEPQYRFCTDYRKLNSVTKKNSAPLPNIADTLDSMEGSTVFSALDLRQGYWQIPLKEEDQEKTAFVTHRGLFQYTRVAFGLCNAPSAFVQLMNATLGNAQFNHVLAYLDDVVVHSKDLESHMVHLKDVMERFERAGLKLKMSKCQFLKPEVSFLGHVVSSSGIHVSPEKVSAITGMTPPTTPREVRGFLGMCSYYRKFLPDFAEVALPLTKLTRKNGKFVWTEGCQKAFELLKHGLATAPILAFPSPMRQFIVHTDASAYAVGAVLSQEDDNGTERVIQYLSHKLTDVQSRWSASERECYAIVYALNKFRHYLLGTRFILYTDHKPLSSLFVSSMKNARIQRWSAMLSEYDMDIRHKAGTKMVQADFLSRQRRCGSLTVNSNLDEDRYLPEIDVVDDLICWVCGRPFQYSEEIFEAMARGIEYDGPPVCSSCTHEPPLPTDEIELEGAVGCEDYPTHGMNRVHWDRR